MLWQGNPRCAPPPKLNCSLDDYYLFEGIEKFLLCRLSAGFIYSDTDLVASVLLQNYQPVIELAMELTQTNR